MRIPPSEITILLVGPRVSHLVPHFSSRGFHVEACTSGSEAIGALEARVRDLVLFELNLGDTTVTELLLAARQVQPQLGFLLLDDVSRAGQIVKAMTAGVHGYLATPPDEERLFQEVEQQVLAARARAGTLAGRVEGELEKLRGDADAARRDALETGMQNDLLRQEIEALRKELDELNEKAETATALEEEAARLKDDLGTVEAERDELKERLEAAQRRLSESTELNIKHAAVIEELEGVKAELVALREERDAAGDLAAELEAARAEVARLEGEVAEARAERDAYEEKALDIELQMEELRTKIAFLEEEAQKATARAEEVETFFKKERLRLIEEKEDAAAGSQEAFRKLERIVDELQAAKQARAEAEARLRELEAKVGV